MTDTTELDLEIPELSKEALRHLKVLRPKNGERIELFDGQGAWRVYSYENNRLAASSQKCFRPKLQRELTLFACVTKGSRWDWTVEKATELGVERIVPVVSERTIVRIAATEREAKRERWQRIAADAARQSDAKWLPEILPPVGFEESLEMVKSCCCFVGALVSPRPQLLADAVMLAMRKDPAPRNWGVFVGPEGDFTGEEYSKLLEIATPTDFGPTVLRAETAAIFALSVLKGLVR
jgi:16S rRNA (uracil1498-N3)-methyltransferase